ncbi:GDYXXLXY domain-containing protein [Brevibacillus composti]|uniref:GDYXXLXY domain-containing protein n=1 Tax=Brevibacillus composti TaxID=2796470 RepID=A0A7T5EJY4_9BACL|nr:GDYXXLXY domain-containing protein [Brevibacillus composti]QQE73973.1 GDYXXLXY domain-containing protein [Brevibacillus composti]QUO41057.1 GDYXXLXY domain-containing protein [Brevibacillus composti]
MRLPWVRLGYLLGIACFLSAVLYFFASNWPAMDRGERIGVCTGMLLLFYLTSYAGHLLWKRHLFLSNWLLAAGGLAFGICVALLGQVYNSHADSYLLFAVWLLPNLLFALITRYQPYYVISYVLVHLTVYFYLEPSVVLAAHGEEFAYWMYLGIACFNALLFGLTARGLLPSRPVYYLSFAVLQFALFISAFADVYGAMPEILYLLAFAGLFAYFLKVRPHRGFLIATAAAGAVFILGKFFLFLIEHFSEGLLWLGLMLAAGLVWGSVAALKWVRQSGQPEGSIWQRAFREAIVVLVTVVASLIGTVCLVILLALMLEGEGVDYVVFCLSAGAFIAPVVFNKQIQDTVRYTLLTMGYLMGAGSSLMISHDYFAGIPFFWTVFLLVLAFVWVKLPELWARLLTQLAFVLVLYFGLESVLPGKFWPWLIISLFQLAMYFVPGQQTLVRRSALVYGLYAFLLLAETAHGIGYAIANIAFFLFATGMMYGAHGRGERGEAGIVLLFWFGFLVSKYYDLLWSLLHKSISLLGLSLLFFGVSFWLDQRQKSLPDRQERAIFSRRRIALLLVILLQFGMIGYQVWNSEAILAHGKTVKLELAPVDPRSLLQGDYVQLSYAISRIDEVVDERQSARVRVVLRKGEDDVYVYSGYHQVEGRWNQAYQPAPDDVIINGRAVGGDRVAYGIENFFVPEGTGLDVERSANYAYVRIGESGDAIVERLAEE